jgi:oligosaccharide repeat unit polymerase
MSVIGSMFGFSVVIFLWINNDIENKYFYQYIFSQIAFFIGFLTFNKMPNKNIQYENIPLKANDRYFYIYIFSAIMYIIPNVVTYLVVGIPIFAKSSRLEYVAVGGGFGIFTRISGVFSAVTYYFTFYFLFSTKKKFIYKIIYSCVLMVIIIITIFSGSKGGVLGIITSLFMFLFLNRNTCGKILIKIKKRQFLIFFCASIMAVLVIIIQSGANLYASFGALMFRLVAFGDAYYMAYPNGIIESLTGTNFFIVFFGDFFRTIRILPEKYMPPGMGFELSAIANNSPGILAGPNARHNIYGYVNFGFFGSIVFSLFCGFILNIVRNRFFRTRTESSHESKILNLILYTSVLGIEPDTPTAIMLFNNLIIFFPFIIIINHILKYIYPNNRIKSIKN